MNQSKINERIRDGHAKANAQTIYGLSVMDYETLKAIYAYILKQEKIGIPYPVAPNIRWIVKHLGVSSTSVVARRLKRLADIGMLYDPQHFRFLMDKELLLGGRGSTTALTPKGAKAIKEIFKYETEKKIKTIDEIVERQS